MGKSNPVTVLFTGYAPVHFLCFQPIYERLARLPGVAVYLSGGLRKQTREGYTYDSGALYAPFGVPPEHILSVDAIQERPFDALFSANKRLILPPENVGTRIQIFHGVSFRNRAVRPENLAYDVFFLAGPYMRRKFLEAGLVEEDDPRAVSVGFPKTDPLRTGNIDRAALLARFGLDGKRPVLLYAPTGALHNSLETMGPEVIRRLARTDRYDLLIKPHDHPKSGIDWFEKLAPLEGPHTRLVRTFDIIPLLSLADLLLTDASSVAYEYTLLNRPIVFLDVPELIQTAREHGALVDLETWGRRGGDIVERPEEVVAAVDAGLAVADRLSKMRQAIARDLFYNPGQATDRAVAWFASRFLDATERSRSPS